MKNLIKDILDLKLFSITKKICQASLMRLTKMDWVLMLIKCQCLVPQISRLHNIAALLDDQAQAPFLRQARNQGAKAIKSSKKDK